MSEKIDHAITKQIAHLSRICISDEETGVLREKMSDILSSFDVLQSIEVLEHEELQPAKQRNDLRQDSVHTSLGQERSIATAPHSFNGHFRVPPVL